MHSRIFPPTLVYGPRHKTSKPMRQILILIEFAKNGTGRHQMDQIMEKKAEYSAINQNYVFSEMAYDPGNEAK